MAEKKYTIRIYDKRIDDRIQRIYIDFPITFRNMNQLMKELLVRGLRSFENEVYNKKDENDESALFEELRHTSERLTLLTKLCNERFKELGIGYKVLQKIAGCNNSILVGISNGTPKDNEYVEKGFYDKLPDRYAKYIEDLLKNYD